MKTIRLLLVLLLICGCVVAQKRLPISPGPPQTSGEPTYRVGGGVSAPRAIVMPDPEYPKEAVKGHQPGSIVLVLIVGSNGEVRYLKVVRGISPEIDQAATEAVKKWKFKPALKDGKPVAVQIEVQLDFEPR